MKIQEAIINRVYKTKYNELCIGLKIKAEDYTPESEAEFREYWQEGTSISLNIERFQGEASKPIKREQTIYEKFRSTCVEYSGDGYYQRVKKHLGVEHLREIGLKHKMSESMVDDVLTCQIIRIKDVMLGIGTCIDPGMLTHKDNAVLKWKQLFEIFNLYNKNEKEI